MKTSTKVLGAFSALFFAASAFIGCSEIDMFQVNAPADLQERIDAIAAEKNAQSHGDTTVVDITKAIVGSEDFSSGWWADHSQHFEVPTGKLLHFEFVNHSSKGSNWNNWNVVCTNVAGNGTDDDSSYQEYFVVRADGYAFSWPGVLSIDYFEEGKLADWDDFKDNFMDNAYVTVEVDHSTQGLVVMTAVAEKEGYDFKITETYQQEGFSASPFFINITTDASWFEMKKAYLIPTKIEEIPDQNPTGIVVTGYPTLLEIGDEDAIGNAVATVTYEDGTSAQVDIDAVTFTVPDLTTVGVKTIVYSYAVTKQGNSCKPVNGYYTLEVVNAVTALEVSKAPSYTTYYVYDAPVRFNAEGVEVTATYADGSEGVISNENLVFGEVPAEAGNQTVKISYQGSTSTIETICEVEVIKGTSAVGSPDFTNGWWSTFSEDYVIAAGESKTLKMMLYSDNLENYHSPCTILRNAALEEYGVVRMDHFGWGGGYDAAQAESNWNWDSFKSSLNMSMVDITVTNNGDGTAAVRYDVKYADGEEHFQSYVMTVNSDDLQMALVTEESYLVLYE